MHIRVVQAELRKIKGAGFVPATFIAFGLAPLLGGLFLYLVRRSGALAEGSSLALKMQAMQLAPDWRSYLQILSQAIGVGGVLVFGFVISWIFGREYSDGTAKDMLALPTARQQILFAKFVVYFFWTAALAMSNLIIACLIGWLLQLPAPGAAVLWRLVAHYFGTFALTALAGTPIAFFALWGKGFIAPLGFVALALVVAQVIAAVGYGAYFPWAIPGIFSGAAGQSILLPGTASYIVIILTAVTGYVATIAFWRYADHRG